MNKKYPVVCVIPSLNPDELFVETLKGIFEVGFTDIIVVDDGSRDSCKKFFEEAKSLGAMVLTHEINKGKGAALKTAFSFYLNNYDLSQYFGVVTADADGQHLPEDIKKTSDELLNQPRDKSCISLGTRDFNEEIVPFKSRNGNKITIVVFNLLFGKKIMDTQTGLRGISNQFITNCTKLKQNRFDYEINMLIDAVKNKVKIIEVPIKTVYYDGNRETHFRPFVDSFKIYMVMFRSFIRYTISGLASWVVDQSLFYFSLKYFFSSMNSEKGIIVATIIARLISSLVNYAINKNFVFEKKGRDNSMIKYYILCVSQMLISAISVAAIHYVSKMNPSIIKIIVDAVIFCVNYKAQQKWVFQTRSKQ